MTAASAVWRAFTALGGIRSVGEIRAWIEDRYPKRWVDLGTTIADLAYPGNASSGYTLSERFLEKMHHGHYRIRQSGEFFIPTSSNPDSSQWVVQTEPTATLPESTSLRLSSIAEDIQSR